MISSAVILCPVLPASSAEILNLQAQLEIAYQDLATFTVLDKKFLAQSTIRQINDLENLLREEQKNAN